MDDVLRGQAEIFEHLFSFVDSMALKCAVELRIADIIHSQDGPIALTQIVANISDSTISSSPETMLYLKRIMRSLVRKKIFTVQYDDGGQTLYGVSSKSGWLLRDSKPSLAPLILMENHPLQMAPWHYLSHCIKDDDGITAYEKAHGCGIFKLASVNGELNKAFNEGLACLVEVVMGAILPAYKDVFGCMGSLVDVGGGTGGDLYEIVRSQPHIKGINFDLPHVIATAPAYDGVVHLAGNMFESVPSADAIFIKWVLHDWSHEECVKILKNCRKAIPEKTGKVIIIEIVLKESLAKENDVDVFDETRMIFDMVMMAHTSCGKERTEFEWKKLLEEGGFPRFKITKIPAIPSIIEAYPF
ncbi:desmethylxanthohumol 6'-O-methyltransferase-like [Humulus lupulus]|uniref:desmethylxanthohumol 6'-O-methyltransferase-like n=1 Tax=Humulus lupulus TaxID=3486 RepID=UPI002B40CFF8|nr:desmethylxanthohumol 6'-O-methyltransferase-like [Humulus lupulus]